MNAVLLNWQVLAELKQINRVGTSKDVGLKFGRGFETSDYGIQDKS